MGSDRLGVPRPIDSSVGTGPGPVPTLVTWGRDDRVSPVDMSLIAMRTLPHGEVHIFPNCGHWVMIEQKQAWEATVSAFLAR